MGDLRNKLRKLEETAAHRAWLKRHFPPKPTPPPPRCHCGVTYGPETRLLACQDKWGNTTYYCDEHLPEEYREIAGLK